MSEDTVVGDGSQERARSKKSRSEMETVIRRAADEDQWDVFTEDPRVIRKLEKCGFVGRQQGIGRRYLLQPQNISFRAAQQISLEERARRAAIAKERFGRKP